MAQQVGDPFSIFDIGFAAWNGFNMPGVDDQEFQLILFEDIVDWLPNTPVLSMATWVQPLLMIQSARFKRSLVMVPNVLISFSFGVMTQATTEFLWTSRPQQYGKTTSIGNPPLAA